MGLWLRYFIVHCCRCFLTNCCQGIQSAHDCRNMGIWELTGCHWKSLGLVSVPCKPKPYRRCPCALDNPRKNSAMGTSPRELGLSSPWNLLWTNTHLGVCPMELSSEPCRACYHGNINMECHRLFACIHKSYD